MLSLIRDEGSRGSLRLKFQPGVSLPRHSANHRPPRMTRRSVRPRAVNAERESQIEPCDTFAGDRLRCLKSSQ